jgi:hypothetical protein
VGNRPTSTPGAVAAAPPVIKGENAIRLRHELPGDARVRIGQIGGATNGRAAAATQTTASRHSSTVASTFDIAGRRSQPIASSRWRCHVC